jgi:hypothetical protein
VLDVGGQTEFRIRKDKEDGGGTSFADLVWKPIVLIEMKKRGVDLQKHYRQAFDYWTRLVPNRPRYVVLCNFDEFRIYDFETQMDSPVDILSTTELPDRWGPLAFLFPGEIKPKFGNDRVAVTRDAADALAACFRRLISPQRLPQVDRPTAQRFILQMLVALFAEDIDLLPRYFVANLLEECGTPTDSYDLIGGLFAAMNTHPPASGGRYKGVPYFNGGLFADPARLELQALELVDLRKAASFNWSKVQPEIFGTLFEHSLSGKNTKGQTDERHKYGAHFTHPADIMKIVGPTIVEPWREQIESAKTLTRLNELLDRLHNFRVLDPACGSGNFLYIAYRELKRIEARIVERIEQDFKSEAKKAGQMRLSFLSAQNFYGIDILPFAVEIAKVTMMIARKLAIDELHITEPALPLDNLDKNFVASDALLTKEGLPMPWPKADVIIGNPPFLGPKLLKPELGPDYVNAIRKAYADMPGMADFCVYWIRRAHDHLPTCTIADPISGRAGLVGTQNIRNNQSRVGGLDHVMRDGTIIEAVDNQPWSGEANVHVSIANWAKTQDSALLPKTRRLWFKVEQSQAAKSLRKKAGGNATKDYELNFRKVAQINSALSDEVDLSTMLALQCAKKPKRCFQGKIPGYAGFTITAEEKATLTKDSSDVIFPYLTGRELLDEFEITRWIIDFGKRDMLQAASYKSAFTHCQQTVLPEVEATLARERELRSDMISAREEHLKRWWQLWNRRDELSETLKSSHRFIGCSRVTRRPIMVFLSTQICPSDLVQVFAFDDDYSFGILQSFLHFELFRKSSRMKIETDTRYSVREVFEKFPWPQTPSAVQVKTVAKAGRDVRSIRAEALPKAKGGLRALYRTLELPGTNPLKDAHEALDAAVLAAYGFSLKADLLTQLLALNHEVADRIEKGDSVVSPGLPPQFTDRSSLVSQDCFQP